MANDERHKKGARKVFQGELFSVWQYDQKLFDGSMAVFEYVDRADAAAIVGVKENGNILMAYDSQPHRKSHLIPPGGRLEEGESLEDGARREFLEETGYEVGELRVLLPKRRGDKTRWVYHIFTARVLKKIAEPKLDPGERIELREFSFDEFLALASHPEFIDEPLRIMLLEAQLDPSKKELLYKKLYD